MKALAGFIMKGRMQAALVIACFAVLAPLLPPVVVFSGAGLALVTLRRGATEGLVVLVLAGAGGALLSWAALGAPQLMLLMVVISWLPTWAAALVLRTSVSLSTTLRVLAVVAAVAVFAAFALLGDPAAWWLQLLRQAAPLVIEQMGAEIPHDLLDQQLTLLAPRFTGVLVSQAIVLVALALFVGRWWQALLYNPGGFGDEFRKLKMGSTFALGTLVLFGLATFAGLDLLTNLAISVSAVLAMFGLSIAHAAVKRVGAGRGWLIGMYVLLGLFMYPMMTLLSLLGAADVWLDLRQRLASRTGG